MYCEHQSTALSLACRAENLDELVAFINSSENDSKPKKKKSKKKKKKKRRKNKSGKSKAFNSGKLGARHPDENNARNNKKIPNSTVVKDFECHKCGDVEAARILATIAQPHGQ